jgi:Zn-dependent protease
MEQEMTFYLFYLFYLFPALVIAILHINLFYQSKSMSVECGKFSTFKVTPLIAAIASLTPIVNIATTVAILTIAIKQWYNKK